MPAKTKETARLVVRRVVDELERKLAEPAAAGGARQPEPRDRATAARGTTRSTGTARSAPTSSTISPNYRTIIPETRSATAASARRCATSSSASTRAARWRPRSSTPASSARCWPRCRAVQTQLVVFDTAVVDLTDELHDPVDLLFGTQLGGGTDINRALGYCQQLIRRPHETILVLISDLYEGGEPSRDAAPRGGAGCGAGVQMVALLALNDDGAPSFDQQRRRPLRRPGRPGLRLHARPLPRPDGRGDPEAGPRALGGAERYRGRSWR